MFFFPVKFPNLRILLFPTLLLCLSFTRFLGSTQQSNTNFLCRTSPSLHPEILLSPSWSPASLSSHLIFLLLLFYPHFWPGDLILPPQFILLMLMTLKHESPVKTSPQNSRLFYLTCHLISLLGYLPGRPSLSKIELSILLQLNPTSVFRIFSFSLFFWSTSKLGQSVTSLATTFQVSLISFLNFCNGF